MHNGSTLFKNYTGDNLLLKYGLLVGTIGYVQNWFNYINPALGSVKALEVQYRSLSTTQATYTLQYKTRTTQQNMGGWWRQLWYGY
jgi:hypothetical protein